MRLAAKVQRGFPVSAATRIVRFIDPRGEAFAPTDLVPKSTLAKRKKDKQPLTKDESEKLYAFARVVVETLRLYHDDRERAVRFLNTAHPLLDDRSPAELALETTAGAEAVMKMLLRADASVAV
ncbi:MAG: antitoxin Xre-like helix-turn-helix domain-containing protein [Pseudomonadota bacterium]